MVRPSAPPDVISYLQTNLTRIGYYCPTTGRYDDPTEFAVMMFQQHFMSLGKGSLYGRVDRATADLMELAGRP